jgi:hypothetical protein
MGYITFRSGMIHLFWKDLNGKEISKKGNNKT